MNKFLRRLIVIALLVGLLPAGLISSSVASAAPAEALGALAAYFPTDTPLFAAVRIDDGHIEALNGLLNLLSARLPAGTVPLDALRAGLDAAVQESHPDGSFAETVRPWLGDFAAVGVTTLAPLVDDDPDNNSELPSAVIAQITDRDGAETFFETIMAPGVEAGYFELRKTAEFTLYASPDPTIPIQLMITEDRLVLALAGLDPVATPQIAPLDSNATFQRGLAALPAADYNVAIYLSGEGLAALQASQAEGLTVFGMDAQETVTETVDALMIGLTILDGTTLTIDSAALLAGEPAVVWEDVLAAGGAIDPAFDAFLGSDAQFVLHTTGLRDSLAALVEAAVAAEPNAAADLDEVAATIRAGVQQTLGLDADEDIASWLTGDYAITFSLDPTLVDTLFANAGSEFPTLERFPFDFGLVVAAVDSEKAQALVAALSDQLPALLAQNSAADVTLTLETIGGHSTIVVSIPVEDAEFALPPLEILISASEDVFALGTRAVVSAALDPVDGLSGQTGYSLARSHALPGAVSFGYVSSAGVQALGDLFGGMVLLGPQIGEVFTAIESDLNASATLTPAEIEAREQRMEEQRQQALLAAQMARAQITNVLSLIDSLAFSTAPGAEGVNLQRVTLTLAPQRANVEL